MMNLREWITEYYTVYERINLKAGTIRSYLTCLCRIPSEWELETLTRNDIQKLINTLSEELSPSTVRHIYHVISKPVLDAPFYGYLDKSAELYRVKLPKMKRTLVHSLSDEELRQLLPIIYKSDQRDIYIVLLNTGMRFCELAGLDIDDINIKTKVIRVERNYYRGQIYNSTKTESGIREIPLNAEAYASVLRNYHIGSGPLFSGSRGNRLSYNTIIQDWHRICKQANIKSCGLHVLRHTFATQMLMNDVPIKVVSALLGHHSISITADIYTDVPLKIRQKAVDNLDLRYL